MAFITLNHGDLPKEMQEKRRQSQTAILKEQLRQGDLSAKKRASLQAELVKLIAP